MCSKLSETTHSCFQKRHKALGRFPEESEIKALLG